MNANLAHDLPLRVAFGVELGPQARQGHFVYDVDQDLLRRALGQGGMTPADMATYPTVIRGADTTKANGYCVYADPAEASPIPPPGVHLELCTYQGTGRINARIVAHEARHLADKTGENRDNFVSEPAKVVRKVAATAVGVALAGVYYVLLKDSALANMPSLGKGLISAAEGDALVSLSLLVEYLTRKQERRARQAERLLEEKGNILKLGDKSARRLSITTVAWSIVRDVVVPDFGR